MGIQSKVIALVVLGLLAAPTAQAAVIDLTAAASSGSANGALFVQGSLTSATGTGVIKSFVRMQANSNTESGYNTDGALEFDTKSGAFTHSIQLKDIPTTIVGGVPYRSFFLDINQGGNKISPLLSLDSLKIHLETTGSLTGYPGSFSASVYDLGVNQVILDAGLGHGSGAGDMTALIPSSVFGTDDTKYVYLYSMFGVENEANDGFEEWANFGVTTPPPPGRGPLTIIKFEDLNQNGIPDTGEALLSGWDFSVTGPESMTLTTVAGGSVTASVLAGTYAVEEINLPTGWTCTTPNPLTNVQIVDGQGTTVFFGNIPEPATLSLLVLGGVGALLRRRR